MINHFNSLKPNNFTQTNAIINYLLAIIDFIQDLFINKILLDEISEFLQPIKLIAIFETYMLQLLNNDNSLSKFLEKQPILEKLILFIISLPKFEYNSTKSRFINILTRIYNVPLLFRLFTNKDDILNNIFHKLILEDKREIFYHFLDFLFPLTIYDLENEYRRRMLMSMINYFSSKIESNNDNNEYDIQCVAAFLKILIKLLCYDNIIDSKSLFEQNLQIEKCDLILFGKVIYLFITPQFIIKLEKSRSSN